MVKSPKQQYMLKVFLLYYPLINNIARQVDVVQVYDGQSRIAPYEVPAYASTNFSDFIQLWSWSYLGVARGGADPFTGALKGGIPGYFRKDNYGIAGINHTIWL